MTKIFLNENESITLKFQKKKKPVSGAYLFGILCNQEAVKQLPIGFGRDLQASPAYWFIISVVYVEGYLIDFLCNTSPSTV